MRFLNILLLWTVSTTIASAAITVPDSNNCRAETRRVVGFELGNNGKSVSYTTADGGRAFLAKGDQGDALLGNFRLQIQSGMPFEGNWVEISEVKFLDSRFEKTRTIDLKVVHLPLRHVLSSADLGLSQEWKIYAYWFDYDRHKPDYGEKVWQIAVRNTKTKRTKTFLASDAEKLLIERCESRGNSR
jgi:hypothetical protein